MVRVLMVCFANICRSPTAEAVLRALVEAEGLAGEIEVDSAGTHGYRFGEAPDPRAQAVARRRGYELSALRCRRVRDEDFFDFDYVVAMDRANYADLRQVCPPRYRGRISLLLGFAPELGREDVPDPYAGGESGFEKVLDLIEIACRGLLREIREAQGLVSS